MFGGTHRRRASFAAAATAALVLTALLTAGAGAGAEAQGGSLHLRHLANFDQPVHIDNAPGFRKLLFVVEQEGRVMVLRNEDKKLGRPFLNIADRVNPTGEQGLLSIAFHPNYHRNRRFYVYYTRNDGTNQVDRFKRKRGSSTRAVRKSRRKVIELPHTPATNHNGGQLQFGPDGKLWLAPGDGGSSSATAQNRGSLLGKLLRIDPKRKRGYTVPNSNPFVGEPGRDEIWARGLRNPFRFTFDAKTGDLAIADVGANTREEVNIRSRGAAKGGNFGWNICEGTVCSGPKPNGYLGPAFEYAHAAPNCAGGGSGPCAITGGYVVRTGNLPALKGRYIYADFFRGQIRSINPNTGGGDASTDLDVGTALSSFGEGRKNRIYVASRNGPIFRIIQN